VINNNNKHVGYRQCCTTRVLEAQETTYTGINIPAPLCCCTRASFSLSRMVVLLWSQDVVKPPLLHRGYRNHVPRQQHCCLVLMVLIAALASFTSSSFSLIVFANRANSSPILSLAAAGARQVSQKKPLTVMFIIHDAVFLPASRSTQQRAVYLWQ
jgi:beta-lactamase regulating signal transducer with metallopeptidase domain